MQKFTIRNGFAVWALLGGLLLPRLAASENLRDNVVVILDASGSMKHAMQGSGRQKMQVAKEALREVLVRSVKETTNLGVLVFSAGNLKSDVLYPLGPVDRAELEQAIMLPEPGHGTPLGTYLKKGADLLLAQRQKQEGYGTYRLLVVTDGEASDRELVDRHLPDILSRGITLDVIGVDMRSDHALATRVHSYRKADDPQALAAAISEVLAEIGGVDEDVPGDDAFSLLETIPEELAKAMLAAVAEARDDPIGAPRQSPAAGDATGRSTATPVSPPRTSPPSPPAPADQRDRGGGDDGGGAGWPALIFFLIIIFVATKRVRKFGRR